MRLVYGVFGYGRGHATRALAVLPELMRRHEVHLIAGGDAYEVLSQRWPVHEVPQLRFVYGAGGKLSTPRTLGHNAEPLADLLLGGAELRALVGTLQKLQPDVAICDAEPFTHQAAQRLGIPRIAFDHYGILAWCDPPIPPGDGWRRARDVWIYRTLMGRPARAIVSSFYPAAIRRSGVERVGTLLRDEVHDVRARRGEHLLVYLNQGAQLWSAPLEEALRGLGLPVVVYGTPRVGADGNLDFRAAGGRCFLEDLARAHAVVSAAGNQLVGEAIHFGKPMLVLPEGSLEQCVNAYAVERMGIGWQVRGRAPTPGELRAFVRAAPDLSTSLRPLAAKQDGRAASLAALERALRELGPVPARRAVRVPRFA